MLQPAPASNVPSPCVNVCRMDPQSGLCEGCLRTLDEIAGWSKMPDAEKRQVWLRLAERGGPAGEAPAAC
jgi:predicted Fe-S protein YdhL (DUF1289 family)